MHRPERSRELARAGMVGDRLSPQLQKIIQSRKVTEDYLGDYYSEPLLDLIWGYQYNSTKAPHTYFDYYFSGQDINVYLDGLQAPTNIAPLPIMEFSFGIQQQKQPVYGFWSYTHDAVMRGTRIVNGQFRIATTSTNYMTDIIAQAAANRAKANPNDVAGLDADEQLIEQYWWNGGTNSTDTHGPFLFSAHPPFNLIIVYGMQTPTVYDNFTPNYREVYNDYKNDTPVMLDTNERMIEADPIGQSQRITILGIELTGMQIEYTPDGQPSSEMYSFFAKDLTIPMPESVNRTRPSTKHDNNPPHVK